MILIFKIENNSFGKNLLDTIALQVKNKAPLAEISKLLGDLKEDLLSQQARDDEIHAEREEECSNAITEYERRIDHASNEISEASSRINTLNKRITELKNSIADYKAKIERTEKSKNKAIETRAQRAEQFESRKAHHKSVLEALDIILEKLKVVGAQALNDETALLQLGKIGKANPIAAFIQVAATLSPEAWENVRNKLQSLRDATAASLADDDDQEAQEIQRHNAYIAKLNTLLTNLRSGLAQDEADLREQEADLAQQQIRLETNTKELENATDGKALKEKQCQEWRDQYFAESEQR